MLDFIERDYPHPYPPRITAFTRTFWDGLTAGRFLTTTGATSRRPTFPPKPHSPHDWNEGVEWIELSGQGTLYAYSMMYAVPAVFRCEAPYRACVVDLDEGVRVVTRLLGDEAVPLDSRVELVALRYTDSVSYAARPLPATVQKVA